MPRSAINAYLSAVHTEATARGYSFDKSKVGPVRRIRAIPTTSGQVDYEWRHLLAKLSRRSRKLHRRWRATAAPQCHPLFKPAPGVIEPWERTGPK